ncbi:MAG: disulfide bond formation protein B [Candidatus Woesearchaeota archaeon]
MKQIIFQAIPVIVLITHIVLIALGTCLLNKKLRKIIFNFAKKQKNKIFLVISATAMSGSLFYSEIMGYTPCPLCWLQRVAIFPIVVLSIVAIKYKDKNSERYILPMAGIGLLLSGYHYISQFFVNNTTLCLVGAVNCSQRITMHFNYISIPLMAFTICLMIILTIIFTRK